MEGLEKLDTKVDNKGESEEAAAEIESDGRWKEIADEEQYESQLKSWGFFCVIKKCIDKDNIVRKVLK